MEVQNQRLRDLVIELRVSQRSYLESRSHEDLSRSRAIAEKIDRHLFDGKKIMPDLSIEPNIVQQTFDFF